MVTGTLAMVSFCVIHASGLAQHGTGGYLRTFVPHIHMDGGALMKGFGVALMVGMAGLEYATAFIRATVLAIRLFANMLAGHTVLFILLYFINMIGVATHPAAGWLFWPVAAGSVAMVFALTLLELFVAGLQAFIFTYLTAVFIGLAKHPPH
jgi:F-type H+-transporting ATPase subunit a